MFYKIAYVVPLAHTRARGSVLSHFIGGRAGARPSRCGRSKLRPSRHGGHAGLSAVAFGEGGTRDPTDVATDPAAGCPPVCQRTSFLPEHGVSKRKQ